MESMDYVQRVLARDSPGLPEGIGNVYDELHEVVEKGDVRGLRDLLEVGEGSLTRNKVCTDVVMAFNPEKYLTEEGRKEYAQLIQEMTNDPHFQKFYTMLRKACGSRFRKASGESLRRRFLPSPWATAFNPRIYKN